MRQGKNPYKNDVAYQPKTITVAMLVFIPSLSGYFKERFEIFKISLESLLMNTSEEFDLLIFDNGSCREVQLYLSSLKSKGVVQYLVQMSENIGILNAYNMIFSMSPGEYIAYSDDDIFFHPGWLQKEMAIADSFSPIGMVSGLPTWQNFGFATQSVQNLIENSVEISSETSQGWPQDWIEDYCESIGREPEAFINQCKNLPVLKITRGQVSAYVTATHCQFLVKKENIQKILPIDTSDNSAMKNVARFDLKFDQMGFLRLSTTDCFVSHMGNVLSEKDITKLRKYQIDPKKGRGIQNKNTRTFLTKAVNTNIGKRVVLKLYNILHQLTKRIR